MLIEFSKQDYSFLLGLINEIESLSKKLPAKTAKHKEDDKRVHSIKKSLMRSSIQFQLEMIAEKRRLKNGS